MEGCMKMEDNSDSEYEYEETAVLVELNGIIDSNFLLKEQAPAKILGLDSEKPILQVGHYLFSGEYEDTLGTIAVYAPVSTTNNEGKEIESYEYLCKTDKKLSMTRIFIQEKETAKLSEPQELHHKVEQFHELATTDTDSAMDCSSDNENATSK